MTLLLEAPVKAQTVNLVRYGMMEIESVLQRTCYMDKYHIFKFLSCTQPLHRVGALVNIV